MNIRNFLLTLIAVSALTACSSQETPAPAPIVPDTSVATAVSTSTISPPPTKQAAPTLDEPAATDDDRSPVEPASEASTGNQETTPQPEKLEPVTQEVVIEAADGLALQATYFSPGGQPPFAGVILLHMLGSSRQAWIESGLPERLQGAGFVVLTVDMRGHGDTGGGRDWIKAENDLARVWEWLAGRDEVDPSRTAVIGASIGANMALRASANEPAIKTAVLLSPGLNYQDVTTEDALAAFGARPLFIVASEEDSYAASSSQALKDQAQGETNLLMFNGAGHGTNMFGAQPDLIDSILDWLDRFN